MNLFLDSFWRALAYCVRPRVIALSFLPLVLLVALALGLGYFFWEGALDWVRSTLEASSVINNVWAWLESVGAGGLKMVLAPLIVIFAVTPILVVLSLLTVAVLMTPALTLLVAERRFPELERKRGGSMMFSLLWSLGSTMLALIAIFISIPLWLVPPLILVLPPLIWGWLTYRVMAFDALAEHASAQERREMEDFTCEAVEKVLTGFFPADVYRDMGMSAAQIAEVQAYRRDAAARNDYAVFRKYFRRDSHTAMVTNLARIGLLTERVRPRLARLGIQLPSAA